MARIATRRNPGIWSMFGSKCWWLTVIQPTPEPRPPTPHLSDKKFNSRFVAPIAVLPVFGGTFPPARGPTSVFNARAPEPESGEHYSLLIAKYNRLQYRPEGLAGPGQARLNGPRSDRAI